MKGKFVIAMLLVGCVLSGCTNSGEQDIGEAKAKEIAFSDAGVNQGNLSKIKVSKEQDERKTIYDVEFIDSQKAMEYDYEILASDGSIYSVETEKFDALPEMTNLDNTQVKIKKEEASKLALDKVAGATEKELYIYLEREKGTYIYDGEIIYNQKEYDFEIDADTGEFLEWREKPI